MLAQTNRTKPPPPFLFPNTHTNNKQAQHAISNQTTNKLYTVWTCNIKPSQPNNIQAKTPPQYATQSLQVSYPFPNTNCFSKVHVYPFFCLHPPLLSTQHKSPPTPFQKGTLLHSLHMPNTVLQNLPYSTAASNLCHVPMA